MGMMRFRSDIPQRDEYECEPKEGPEGQEVALVAYQEPPEVAHPSEGPLNLPTLRVARAGFRWTFSFGLVSCPSLVRRDRRFYTLRAQPRSTAGCSVINLRV